MRWLATIKQVDDGKLVVEKMELDETGFPQPTGEIEELEADSVVLALGQEADLSLLEGVPGIEVDDGVVAGRPGHDDRAPRDLRRRRHGAGRAHRHRRHRPRQAGRAQHRRLAARRAVRARRRARRSATFDELNTWYYADAPRVGRPSARARRAARPPSTRSCAGSTRRTPSSRRAAACRAATASPATTATASAPTTRCSSSATADGLRDRPRLLQGLRHLRRRVPVRRDRDGARGDLSVPAPAWRACATVAPHAPAPQRRRPARPRVRGVRGHRRRGDGAQRAQARRRR